jgi:small conductance mechanosensitive channel
MENQFRVDDIVTLATPVATVSGVVEDISIRITKLRDLDGNLHILSNGSIGVITNKSFQYSNINLNINVSYDTDIDLVEKLINETGEAIAQSDKFKDAVIEPITFLRVESLNESNVTIKAFGKVRPGAQYIIGGDFRRRLKNLLVKHHITIVTTAVVKVTDE